jgi:phenylacetate-CoA ligase
MTSATVDAYVAAIRKHQPLFLKGLPSALYYFSLFLREKGTDDISFKAVFSTGEILSPRFRKLIEATFRCKVYDSYGHMERTVAISECPCGGLHINPDYGVLELIRQNDMGPGSAGNGSGPPGVRAKVLGTSLYSYSMPLLRYEVGDLVQIGNEQDCECGRKFPLVHSFEGRQSEVIITPQGKVVTAAFLIFEGIAEILAGQIVQESIAELRLRVVTTPQFSNSHEKQLVSALRTLVGQDMKIAVERYANFDSLKHAGGKIRSVISKLHGEFR